MFTIFFIIVIDIFIHTKKKQATDVVLAYKNIKFNMTVVYVSLYKWVNLYNVQN